MLSETKGKIEPASNLAGIVLSSPTQLNPRRLSSKFTTTAICLMTSLGARFSNLKYDIPESVVEIMVRRACERHGIDSSAAADGAPQETRTMILCTKRKVSLRRGELETPADQVRLHFWLSQTCARHNTQFAMRVMQELWVRACQLR